METQSQTIHRKKDQIRKLGRHYITSRCLIVNSPGCDSPPIESPVLMKLVHVKVELKEGVVEQHECQTGEILKSVICSIALATCEDVVEADTYNRSLVLCQINAPASVEEEASVTSTNLLNGTRCVNTPTFWQTELTDRYSYTTCFSIAIKEQISF